MVRLPKIVARTSSDGCEYGPLTGYQSEGCNSSELQIEAGKVEYSLGMPNRFVKIDLNQFLCWVQEIDFLSIFVKI